MKTNKTDQKIILINKNFFLFVSHATMKKNKIL